MTKRSDRSTTGGSAHLRTLAVIAAVTILAFAPFIDTVWWFGDEGILLNGAVRMLHGQVLYRDFFEFLPPGGFAITKLWLLAVGKSLFVVRLLTLLLLIVIVCCTYLASFTATRARTISAALPLLWLVMAQGSWPELSHHWISIALAMIAIAATLAWLDDPAKPSHWPFLAGLAAGTAGMVTETVGALVMLASLIAFLDVRKGWRSLLAYLLGCAIVPLFFILDLASHGDLVHAIDDVIIFPSHHYSNVNIVHWGFNSALANFPFALLYPALFLALLAGWRRNWRELVANPAFRMGTIYALAGFLLCFPRPDMFHIAYTVPLALPLTTVFLARLREAPLPVSPALVRIVARVIVLLPVTNLALTVFHQVRNSGEVMTKRGAIIIQHPAAFSRLFSFVDAIPRDQPVFFFPYDPMLAYLTGRINVSEYDLFTPGYTTATQFREICSAVMSNAVWVVDNRAWNARSWTKEFPSIRNFGSGPFSAFAQVMKAGFGPYGAVGSYQILHRNAETTPAHCSRIRQKPPA